MKKIAIGAIVRNRGWILPDYLAALDNIVYDNKSFLFLENDSDDDTNDLLMSFIEHRHGILEKITTNHIDWERNTRQKDNFAHYANMRNKFLELFLTTSADYLLSVDSDVIVPPDIVERLMEHQDGRTIIASAISNVADKQLDGMTPGNWMYMMNGAMTHPQNYPLSGVHDVDLTGAVYMIPRQAIVDGVRYFPHYQGEDVPFCIDAKEKGYSLKIHMDVRSVHCMTKR